MKIGSYIVELFYEILQYVRKSFDIIKLKKKKKILYRNHREIIRIYSVQI